TRRPRHYSYGGGPACNAGSPSRPGTLAGSAGKGAARLYRGARPATAQRAYRRISDRYGVGVRSGGLWLPAGSSAGFVLAFLSLLDKGDRLGLPSPGYPCYRQILKALDVRPTLIETSGQGRWMPTVADVERLAGEGTAGLLLASPNN